MRLNWLSWMCVGLLCLTACGDDDGGDGDGMDAGGEDGGGIEVDAAAEDAGDEDGGVDTVATLPSQGSSIAAAEVGDTIAVANFASDSVTFFEAGTLTERGRVDVGDEPASVTFSPDGTEAYVVNRADQTVSVITGADGSSPTEATTIAVGSEPRLAALSPTGATLYVTNWVDGTLSVIDTASRSVTATVALGGNPYAVCVTNDGDGEDDDETVYVTDFYSRAIEGEAEATDRGREARVFHLDASDITTVASTITLDPIDVTGINAEIDAANTGAFPNQLYACTVHDDHLYVTAVGASPEPFGTTTDFRQNIHGLLYEVAIADDSVTRELNLNQMVAALEGEKRFAAVPTGIAFVPGTTFGYLSVMTANMVLRIDLAPEPPTAGSPTGTNFLATGPSPTGIAITGGKAYTYNEVGRSVSQIDLPSQTTEELEVTSAPLPSAGTSEFDALRGQRFFNTGLARWSTGAWVGCVGCHPSGTTDNVTWTFPAGPRQTSDTSATFDRSQSTQRILNWTAIFDEVHDFELNTRGVANGVGAIVTDAGLDTANRIDFLGAGGPGNPENGFNVGSSAGVNERDGVLADWNEIEAYIRTIRSPRGATVTEGDPAEGATLFAEGGCANCHGGVLWTLSERYSTPVVDGDLRAVSFADEGVTSLGSVSPATTVLDDLGFDTALINNDTNGAPQRHLCVVREVGTFGAGGADDRGAAETRQNGGNAQGVDGFNVPSLLGMATGAPYLHNGAAETLDELLSDPDFQSHLIAGNAIFSLTAEERANLIAFIRTVDDDTTVVPLTAGHQLCPEGVTPPTP